MTDVIEPGITVPGLQMLEEVGRGAQSVVYRARRGSDCYAVKVERQLDGHRDPRAVRRFKKEATTLARIDASGLPSVLALGETDDRCYAVMEYISGQTLTQYLSAHGKMPERQVVEMAQVLAEALDELHRLGLVHRDVKPPNILIDPAGRPKLIDLGFVTETRNVGDTGAILGTFEYCAPEQTGMLKLPMDGRGDLYSLGVVLFQALTGHLPFRSSDPAELIRQHAIQPPPDPRTYVPGLSLALTRILLKLLAKDPDDRYLTARSLVHDLERLDALDRQLNGNEVVLLGAAARAYRASPPLRFVAREGERSQLDSAWRKAWLGSGQLVHVEGDDGVGKTALVESFLHGLEEEATTILRAPCSPTASQPFAPLIEAVNSFVNDLRADSDLEASVFFHDLRSSVFAPLLKGFAPALTRLLTDVPDVGEVDIDNEQYSFAVADLLGVVATSSPGAVLYVDDIQWLDNASFRVLRHLARRLRELPLLLIVTREPPAEAASGYDPLTTPEPDRTTQLTLGPLEPSEVGRLVESFLGAESVEGELVAELQVRTHGSPLAIVEYLEAMLDQGLLYPCWGKWVAKPSSLRTLKLPDSVTDLIAARIHELDRRALEVLSTASLLGPRFDVELLTALCDDESDEIIEALVQAHALRLVEPGDEGGYVFAHERVREALEGELEAQQKKRLHQKTAWELLHHPDLRDASRGDVYAIADHFLNGIPEEAPADALQAVVEAAVRAVEGHAHERALEYLEEASALAEEFDLATDETFYAIQGQIYAQFARVAEAKEAVRRGLELARDPMTRARLHGLEAGLYLVTGEAEGAREAIERALADLGKKVTHTKQGLLFSTLRQWLQARWTELVSATGKGPGKKQTDTRTEALVHELTGLAIYVGIFAQDPLYTLNMHFRTVNSALRLAPSRELVRDYGGYAFLLADLGLKRRARKYMEKARRIAEGIRDPVAEGSLLSFESAVKVQSGDLTGAEETARQCIENFANLTPRIQFVNTFSILAWLHCLQGRVAAGWQWMEQGVERSGLDLSSADQQVNPWIHASAAVFLLRSGRYSEARAQLDRGDEIVDRPATSPFHRRMTWAYKSLYLLESGELGPELDELIARTREIRHHTAKLFGRLVYVTQMYACLARIMEGPRGEDAAALSRLRLACRELRPWRKNPLLRAHSLVGEAALAWLDGEGAAAHKKLAAAEGLAGEVHAPWVLIEVALLRRSMALRHGNRDLAPVYERCARQVALEVGWKHRAIALDLRFTRPTGTQPPESTTSHYSTALTDDGSSLKTRLDAARSRSQLDALLEVSLASVSHPDFQHLARSALDAVIQVAAAERGFLFLLQGDSGELVMSLGREDGGSDIQAGTGYSTTVVDRVHMTREPMIVSSGREGQLLGSESMVMHDIRSIVAVPLELRNRLIGVLYLDSRLSRGIFTTDDLEILQAVGSQLAIVLENARATQLAIEVEAEKQRHELSERIRQMTSALLSTRDAVEIVRLALAGVEDTLSPLAALAVVQEEDRMRYTHRGGTLDEARSTLPQPVKSLVRLAPAVMAQLRARGHLCRGTFGGEARWQEGYPVPGSGGSPLLAVPLTVADSVIGGLIVVMPESPLPGRREEDIAQTFVGPAAMALENARLFHQVERLATTDELTGLPNRRHLFSLGDRELERCRRHGFVLCAVMMDVDHFKTVNDAFGHTAGDQVLAHIGRLLADSVRTVDITSRYGGEEFTVLMPDTPLSDALVAAEGLRRRFASQPFEMEAGKVALTMSLGVAEYDRQESLMQLLNRADEALYSAKQAGRNRVMVYPHRDAQGD